MICFSYRTYAIIIIKKTIVNRVILVLWYYVEKILEGSSLMLFIYLSWAWHSGFSLVQSTASTVPRNLGF